MRTVIVSGSQLAGVISDICKITEVEVGHLLKLGNRHLVSAEASGLETDTLEEVAVALQSDAREKSLVPVEKALKHLNEEVERALNG